MLNFYLYFCSSVDKMYWIKKKDCFKEFYSQCECGSIFWLQIQNLCRELHKSSTSAIMLKGLTGNFEGEFHPLNTHRFASTNQWPI